MSSLITSCCGPRVFAAKKQRPVPGAPVTGPQVRGQRHPPSRCFRHSPSILPTRKAPAPTSKKNGWSSLLGRKKERSGFAFGREETPVHRRRHGTSANHTQTASAFDSKVNYSGTMALPHGNKRITPSGDDGEAVGLQWLHLQRKTGDDARNTCGQIRQQRILEPTNYFWGGHDVTC